MERKQIEKGVYKTPPPETPAQYKGTTPRAGWVTVYELRKMEPEALERYGLTRYLRDEGGAGDDAAAK